MKVATQLEEIINTHMMRTWALSDQAMDANNDAAYECACTAGQYARKTLKSALNGQWRDAKASANTFDFMIAKAANIFTHGEYAHSATRESMYSKISKLARTQ